MFDHVGLRVTNLAVSKAFFLSSLQPLGVTLVMEGPHGGAERKVSVPVPCIEGRLYGGQALASLSRREGREYQRSESILNQGRQVPTSLSSSKNRSAIALSPKFVW